MRTAAVEALWYGLPVVLTPAGAQGLQGIEGVVPVETDPMVFATAVSDLLTDDALWRRCSAAQIIYARGRFSETAQRLSLRQALEIVPPRGPRAVGWTGKPVKACTDHAAMA